MVLIVYIYSSIDRSDLGLHEVLGNHGMVLPDGRGRLILGLGGEAGEGAAVPVDVLELVDFAARLAGIGRVFLAADHRVNHVARCGQHGLCICCVRVFDEVRVRLEVELTLLVVHNSRHGTLSHPFDTLLPSPLNLPLHVLRVIVLYLLNPTHRNLS